MTTLQDWRKISDFREFLLREIHQRQSRRASYSRRAFARDIEMNHTTLHDVLAGRFGISVTTARKIADRLKFDSEKAAYFVELVRAKHARSKTERDAAKKTIRTLLNRIEPEQVDDTILEVTSQWYYSVILELITVFKGKITSAEIAGKLEIPVAVVDESISKLCGLGLLEIEDGKFLRKNERLYAERKLPSQAIRSFHKQLIEKSKHAIDTVPIDKRKNISLVFSCDSSRIAEAREKLEALQREFITDFLSEDDPDSVYAFCIQYFPLADGRS